MADERNYDDLALSNEEQLTIEWNEDLKDHEYETSITSISSTAISTTASAPPQTSTLPEALVITQLNEVVSNITNNTRKATTKSQGGIDASALNTSFVTGAPLDLDNEENRAVAYRNRYLHRSASTTNPSAVTLLKPTSGKPRHITV
ncbi:hypothetical protein KIN20_001189 [Parelaphostrongylus tenuis]|uniref:Uncharacterized protein n=1 Tax=Parelaphostrongylus tenuis TaxID=148309 RepID=A0AAD5MEV3_PARTN|nr:hypothetical protein KIN20_001189 [Parelaphostrongylus tenuis]